MTKSLFQIGRNLSEHRIAAYEYIAQLYHATHKVTTWSGQNSFDIQGRASMVTTIMPLRE